MTNKTTPWPDLASGTALGVAGGIAEGIVGISLLNEALVLVSAGSYVGYQVAGEKSAAIGIYFLLLLLMK